MGHYRAASRAGEAAWVQSAPLSPGPPNLDGLEAGGWGGKTQLLVRWEVGHMASQPTCARVLKDCGRCFKDATVPQPPVGGSCPRESPRGGAAWVYPLRGGDCMHSSLALPGAIGWHVAPGLRSPGAERAAAAQCGSELWRHQVQKGKWLDARVARAAGGRADVSRGETPFSSVHPQGSCSSQCPSGPWRLVLLR